MIFGALNPQKSWHQ